MVTDTISDLIIRLKNAASVKKASVVVNYSKMNAAILDLLEKEGYVSAIARRGKKGTRSLEVAISYDEHGVAKVSGVKRISKPSKRLYRKASELRPVKNGYGLLIISTPKGIISGLEAKRQNVGGEPLFEIW